MAVYLLHGFRWPRSAIRIYIEVNDVEDAAADYICSTRTSAALHANLCNQYPELISSLPSLRFIEQHNPEVITGSPIQPFAFVADKVEICQLSIDIGATIGTGIDAEGWGALTELRDHLAPGEKIGWWVVYNGDEERSISDTGETSEGNETVVFLGYVVYTEESLIEL